MLIFVTVFMSISLNKKLIRFEDRIATMHVIIRFPKTERCIMSIKINPTNKNYKVQQNL